MVLCAEESGHLRLGQVGGLQTQYAPSGYVGLWTRLREFRRADLTAALEDRSVIQATLMRTTIHMVSRREYWAYELGVREARRASILLVANSIRYWRTKLNTPSNSMVTTKASTMAYKV